MPVARSTKETFTFVTVADQALPKERQTTFHLKRLPTSTMIRLRDLREGDQADVGSWMLVALAAGVEGWENLLDDEGKPVEFEKLASVQGARRRHEVVELCAQLSIDQVAAKSTIDRLRTEDAQEVAIAVMQGNELSVNDAKK